MKTVRTKFNLKISSMIKLKRTLLKFKLNGINDITLQNNWHLFLILIWCAISKHQQSESRKCSRSDKRLNQQRQLMDNFPRKFKFCMADNVIIVWHVITCMLQTSMHVYFFERTDKPSEIIYKSDEMSSRSMDACPYLHSKQLNMSEIWTFHHLKSL